VAVRLAALVSDESALEACTRIALYKLTSFTFLSFVYMVVFQDELPVRRPSPMPVVG